jgi:hypothetical protein
VRRRGARGKCARARGRAHTRGGDGKRCSGGCTGHAGVIQRDLEEEEARLLLFEVRSSLFCRVAFSTTKNFD